MHESLWNNACTANDVDEMNTTPMQLAEYGDSKYFIRHTTMTGRQEEEGRMLLCIKYFGLKCQRSKIVVIFLRGNVNTTIKM